jgi:hypothetical protein
MADDWWTGSDASNPDFALPGQVVQFYCGGATPHVWTKQQIDMQTSEFLLPVYVPFGWGSPVAEAEQFLSELADIGVPDHVAYMLDAELLGNGDASQINAFCDLLAKHHYGGLIYGSIDQVFTWPPRSGYVVANPTGVPHMYEHPFVKGTQWDWETRIDRDLYTKNTTFWRNPNAK